MLHKILPILALLTATLFGDSIPKASGDQPGTQLIGETFSQQLCFENDGNATGYEPQLELVTPAGIKLTAATFYGSGTISHQETCMATDCNVTNPSIGQPNTLFSPIDGNESYYVLDFPIGSFSTEWPKQCMDLTFELENSGDHVQPGNPLDIKTVAVFSLGETAVDDGNYTYGPEHDLTVIPNVYTIEKQNDATEAERATGPKYPIRATITVDIAKDENLTALHVVDELDGGMQFTQIITDANCTHSNLPSTTSPGGTLDLDCGARKGVLGSDLTITYEYYIPEVDNNGSEILGGDCQWRPLLNRAHATGVHDFNGTYPVLPQIDANSTVTAKAITMHKTSRISQDAPPAGFGPGDQVEYILTMDISGYADQSHIVISDTIGDGQDYNTTAPNDYNLSSGISGTISTNNIDVTYDSTTGTSLIKFDLSQQLLDDHNISIVDANTTITVKFITTIDEKYKVINNAGHIAMGDVVANHVDLDTAMGDGVTPCQTEKSDTSNTVATEQMTKTIYAVNGNTNPATPYLIHPGDTVTYRLKSVMPVKSFFAFKLLDYLPIPFFKATEVTTQDASGSTTAGTWAIGPDNTYDVNPPILTKDAAQNSLTWDFGEANVTQTGTTLDLLFTVTATNEPMADSLTLANIGGTKYKNAANVDFGTADLVDVITQQPFVKLEKTIISTSNDQGQILPSDSLDKVDANDTITYRIHLENTGHSIAYDVNITDRFEQDGILGQGLHSCNIINTDTNGTTGTSTTGDLFTGTYTIESIDALSYFDVTYTCTVDQDASPGPDINNTATLKAYASTPGGPNFVHLIIKSETKLIMVEDTKLTKKLIDTSLPSTLGDNLNPGEIAYFEINATMGEGTYKAFNITDDTCDAGTLQYVSSTSNVLYSGLGSDLVVSGTDGTSTGSVIFKCQYQATVSSPKTSNTAKMTATNITDVPSNTVTWTVNKPNPNPTKTMDPSTADAGDTVTVTMDWDSNNTNNPSYQCHVTDQLDPVFDWTSISITDTPAGYTCDANTSTGLVTCDYNNTLQPCGTGPAKFTVKIKDYATIGGDIINTIDFTGKSLPSDHNNTTDPIYNASTDKNASATLRLRSPVKPIKIFTKTSEDFTDPGDVDLNNTPPVAIGEVIDVQITFGFYEGTTRNVDLDEVFDTEVFSYIPGTMQLMRSSTNIEVQDSDINASFGNTSGIFVSVSDNKLTENNSTLMRLHLGDVYHNNATGSQVAETLTWRFRIKVQNETLVQSGLTVSDHGRVRFVDGVSGGQRGTNSDLRNALIVEPLPRIIKDVNQTTVQAGTSLKYTIQVCNDEQNSTANNQHATSGFNWIISDRIPDDIDWISGPTVDTNGTGAIVDTSASSGQDINATINRLHRGQCVSISYDAQVKTTAHYGQVMTNTAKYQTTSLPGTYGSETNLTTLPNTSPGELNGKRTGTGGTNDLFGHDDATVAVETGIMEKFLLSHAGHYAIGEQAHYQLIIGLPKGESNHFKVIDTLPAGLHFEDASVHIIPDPTVSYTGTPNPPQVTGNVITFDFGDVNTTNSSTIRIDYNVTVENNLSNQDGTPLTNSVKTTYDDPNNPGGTITLNPPNLPTITVGEPNIEIQKSIVLGAVNAQAGSTVRWKVVISNASANNAHTTAYAVDWNDTLPAHLAQIQNYTLSITGHPKFTGTNDDLNSSAFIENNTTLALQKFDLPVDATVTVEFDSIVQNDAVAGETLTNNTTANYKSILGADGSLLGGRNSTDCGDDDDNSTLNNYCESATADLIIDAGLAIDKRIQGTQVNYTIGETVTYEMKVSLIEGVTSNVVLSDTLPTGLKYVSHTCSDAGGTLIQYDCMLTSGTSNPVVIEFGDVDNPADGNPSNDYIDVELTVLVENVVGNQNGDTPTNGDTAGTLVTVTSDANTSAVTVPVPITIVEPDLNVTKTVTPTISGTPSQALGDIITYHIHVSHTANSTSDAWDVNFTDTLDPGLEYIPGSSVGTAIIPNGQVLSFSFSYIKQGTKRDVYYKARIKQNATVGVDLNNSLDTVYGSIPGANGSPDGGRNGTDGIGPDSTTLNNYALHTSVPVTPNDNKLTPVKSVNWKDDKNNDGLISAGDTLEYNLSVTNNLGYDVGDVNISDTLDPNVTLLLDSVAINGTSVGNDSNWTQAGTWYTYATTDVTLNYDSNTNYFEVYWQKTLAPGQRLDVAFDVKINDGNTTVIVFGDNTTNVLDAKALVDANTTIENIFTVDSNRTVPTPSNEVNVTTDQRGVAAIPVKTLTATDRDFTDPGDANLMNTPPVAVGEIVDVMLDFNFTGGTTKEVVLKDNFDRSQLVRVNEANLTRSCDDMWVGDLNSTFGTDMTISVESNITDTPNGFELKIGDIFNPRYQDMDMTCSLQLTFRLRVDNNTAVQQGVQLNDNGSVSFSEYHADSNSSSTSELHSPDVGVMAVEPDVEVTKSVDPMTAKAGEQVLYTLKVCNDESNQTANTASAFDWTVTDTLPVEFDLGSSGYVPNSMGTGATVTIDSGALPNLNARIDRLDQGECIRIDYNITVTGAAQFEQDINNTVRVEATSLPGTVPGERTGMGKPPLNDLHNTSTATLKVEAPGVRKDIVAQKSYYPIGETVEYNITLAFTGSARDLEIVDHFPVGLAYIPGSARLRLPADTNVSFNPPQESGNGYDWTFVIGDLNITTSGNLYLELNATVEDIVANENGVKLTNTMDMHFIDPNTGAPVDINAISPAITVGEPELHVSKTITTDLSVPKSAGDVISYEISITNTGTTTAYYTEWEDKVPVHTGEIYNPHLAVYAGTAYETNTTTPVTDANFSISTVEEPDDKIALVPFDLSPGATLVITFDTIIQPNVIPAETLVNITGATTQSTVLGGRKHIGIHGDKYASVAEVSFSINQLPEAKDDGCYRVTTYSAYTWDIAANDKLGDGTKAEHTWRLITPPSDGTVSISKDGYATYTPYANYNGPDSFRYEMEDSNGDKSQANVCIDVDCASSQTSDGGDAYSMWTMLTLMFFTAMIGLYYVRKEENRREENRYE